MSRTVDDLAGISQAVGDTVIAAKCADVEQPAICSDVLIPRYSMGVKFDSWE